MLKCFDYGIKLVFMILSNLYNTFENCNKGFWSIEPYIISLKSFTIKFCIHEPATYLVDKKLTDTYKEKILLQHRMQEMPVDCPEYI